MIKRCNKLLEGYEEKLQLVRKFLEAKQSVEKIQGLIREFKQSRSEAAIDEIERISNQIIEEL